MIERQENSRLCFVCGRDNPVGLRLRWDIDRSAREVRAEFSVPELYNGYPGIVHGGIVSTILDEAMGRSVLVDGKFEDTLVTAWMEVSFLRPTPIATPLTVVARLTRYQPLRARAEAEIRLPDGTLTARAQAILGKPPVEVVNAWIAERVHWKVDP